MVHQNEYEDGYFKETKRSFKATTFLQLNALTFIKDILNSDKVPF